MSIDDDLTAIDHFHIRLALLTRDREAAAAWVADRCREDGITYVDAIAAYWEAHPSPFTSDHMDAMVASVRTAATTLGWVVERTAGALAVLTRAFSTPTVALSPDIGARCHAAHQRATIRRLLDRQETP